MRMSNSNGNRTSRVPASNPSPLHPRSWDPDLLATLLVANGATAIGSALGPGWAISSQFPASAYAGGRALATGGSAADAFVVATLVDCVLTAGASSLAGMTEVVVRDGGSGDVGWFDGGYRVPLVGHDGEDDWTALTTGGRAPLVGGLVRALHNLWKRFGRLAWPDLFLPAIHLAAVGFPAYPRLAALVSARRDALTDADARDAFFPDGRRVGIGGRVRQRALATTLAAIASDGPSAMYGGAWASEFVDRTRATGGVLTLDDLAACTAPWSDPC